MGIGELTSELKVFIEESRDRLERILAPAVRQYVEAVSADPEWCAAVLHNTGAEADEAVRLSGLVRAEAREELSRAVATRLASGVLSTTLMPALLPTTLLGAANQALLGRLRDVAAGEDGEP